MGPVGVPWRLSGAESTCIIYYVRHMYQVKEESRRPKQRSFETSDGDLKASQLYPDRAYDRENGALDPDEPTQLLQRLNSKYVENIVCLMRKLF